MSGSDYVLLGLHPRSRITSLRIVFRRPWILNIPAINQMIQVVWLQGLDHEGSLSMGLGCWIGRHTWLLHLGSKILIFFTGRFAVGLSRHASQVISPPSVLCAGLQMVKKSSLGVQIGATIAAKLYSVEEVRRYFFWHVGGSDRVGFWRTARIWKVDVSDECLQHAGP